MPDVVGAQLAVGQVPHLDQLVPTARHDDGVGRVGRESHARHPLGVAVLLDHKLTLAKGVPEADGLCSGTTKKCEKRS